MKALKQIDPIISTLINSEVERQRSQLRMIPSENYVSEAVLQALGSPLVNKYSEGQVGKRYYQGNQFIDKIEKTAKDRALKLFNLDPKSWSVNVQAVTGSIANLAVYSALLKPNDKIMGMHLYDGGHLSHGWKLPNGKPVSFTSRIFDTCYYHVDPTTRIFDYKIIAKTAKEEKPKIIISGGTAYPREINHKKMAIITKTVGAYYLADIAHEAGLVAAKVNQSPFPHADVVTMTTRKTLRGPIGALIFSKKNLAKDIDQAVFPGLQGGPQNHSIAAIAVSLHEAMQPQFKNYAKQVIKNAAALAQELIRHGYDLVSGGTDKHLLLIDLRNKNITGTQAATTLELANIILNKNTVPQESGKPWNPSGIRLGTPAITTRGMKEKEMKQIANMIHQVLLNIKNEKVIVDTAKAVTSLTDKFPIY